MENEEVENLFEELEGKVELGMREEALAICETILCEAGKLNVYDFGELCRIIGMFSDDMLVWRERLTDRFSALNECERLEGACYWVSFLAAADAEWQDIKPHVSLRKLDEDSILLACLSAVSAGDDDWCRESLPVLGSITQHHSAECAHRLSFAVLLEFMGNPIGALEAMQGFKIDAKWFETYLQLLAKSTAGHFLKSLERLTEEIKVLGNDSEMERLVPGNDRERFDDLMKSISKARAAVLPLTEN